ncbi:helix-turn-helix domain-containing protein [Rhodoferax sp.]|uniref:helix-turn-helix domain-containing protein n=1 Tax=Rhodoferax sp. TaxID=50421 RepID=UPI00344C7CA0
MREHPDPSTTKSKLPKMTYTHLTQVERYQIEILHKANYSQSEIAALLERDKSPLQPPVQPPLLDQGIDRRNHRQRQHRAGDHAADHRCCDAAHHF